MELDFEKRAGVGGRSIVLQRRKNPKEMLHLLMFMVEVVLAALLIITDRSAATLLLTIAPLFLILITDLLARELLPIKWQVTSLLLSNGSEPRLCSWVSIHTKSACMAAQVEAMQLLQHAVSWL